MDSTPQTVRFTTDFWTAMKIGAGLWTGLALIWVVWLVLLIQLAIRGVRRLFHKSEPATP
jgi:hypothetical protein